MRVETWFERDRSSVILYNENEKTLFELWDEDVAQAVEDGFLDPKDYKSSMIKYAKHLGIIN